MAKKDERMLRRLVKGEMQKHQDSPVTDDQVKKAIKSERERMDGKR